MFIYCVTVAKLEENPRSPIQPFYLEVPTTEKITHLTQLDYLKEDTRKALMTELGDELNSSYRMVQRISSLSKNDYIKRCLDLYGILGFSLLREE